MLLIGAVHTVIVAVTHVLFGDALAGLGAHVLLVSAVALSAADLVLAVLAVRDPVTDVVVGETLVVTAQVAGQARVVTWDRVED